jgi:hypothetical protein
VYEAATDNTERLRLVVGASATQLLAARQQMSDIEFKELMKTSVLGALSSPDKVGGYTAKVDSPRSKQLRGMRSPRRQPQGPESIS